MSVKRAQKNITIKLAERLAGRGFRKVKGNDYTIVRPWNEAEAQIRCAVRKDESSDIKLVALGLGIRFEAMQELLPPGAYADSDTPTIGTSIDSLRGDQQSREWDAGEPETVDALLGEVETYAIPFFERYSKLNEVLRILQENKRPYPFSMDAQERIEKMAAILVLIGRKDEGCALLDDEIEREKGKHFVGRRLRLQKLREKFLNCERPQ